MLKDSILKTISFFSLFNFPLTAEEIYSGLWGRPKAEEYILFLKELEEIKNLKLVEEKHGLYFLPGESDAVENRQNAVPIVEAKLKRARRAARLISWIPFLRAIFVCNSISFGLAKPNSDIDFFIVAQNNRIWIVRFLSNFILLLFGMRVGKSTADQICLSFYVDSNNLDLKRISISEDDIYLCYWLKNLIPIFDPENYQKKIYNSNEWCKKNILLEPRTIKYKEIELGKMGSFFKKIGEMFWQGAYGNLIESESKKIQIQKLKINKIGNNVSAPSVVIEDGMLKFHEKDIRAELRNKWLEKCSSIIKTYVF